MSPVRLGAARSSRRANPYSKSNPGMLSTRDKPPAKAVKKKSGKTRLGKRSDGVVKTLCKTRQATANATNQKAPVPVPPPGRAGFARSSVGSDRSDRFEVNRE